MAAKSAISVNKDGNWYVAVDDITGIASQGKTECAAIDNLNEALELYLAKE